MNANPILELYDFSGRSFFITGGGGLLCSVMARALWACGANVAIADCSLDAAHKVVAALALDGETGNPAHGRGLAVQVDVLDRASVEAAVARTLDEFGCIDGLINGAGGNRPAATAGPDKRFFDLPVEDLRFVVDLNLMGTMIPCQVIGRHMAELGSGVILNISSMNALRPLTRIPAYSAAKAAVTNFTQWLAVHMAQEYTAKIRVNALAPGFLLTEQNRYLLTDIQTGQPTDRGRKILEHTPMGCYQTPTDLIGPTLWLLSAASQAVTGIVVPVDGGFSAYSGV